MKHSRMRFIYQQRQKKLRYFKAFLSFSPFPYIFSIAIPLHFHSPWFHFHSLFWSVTQQPSWHPQERTLLPTLFFFCDTHAALIDGVTRRGLMAPVSPPQPFARGGGGRSCFKSTTNELYNWGGKRGHGRRIYAACITHCSFEKFTFGETQNGCRNDS